MNTTNCISEHPKFIDPDNGDFRIASISPMKNIGNNCFCNTSSDLRGNTRIQNITIDMGAYEWNSGPDKSNPVYVNSDFNSSTVGFGIFRFDTLQAALVEAEPNGKVILSNYTHDADIDLSGFNFEVGDEDFKFGGWLNNGLIKVTGNGYIVRLPNWDGVSFPITDGIHNETVNVISINPNNPSIKVRILDNQNISGSTLTFLDVIDLKGPDNLNATVLFRIDKALLAPITKINTTSMRWYDGEKYVPIPPDKIRITNNDSYYLITITNVNKF